MKKLTPFLLGTLVMFGASACNVAQTSGDAPDSVEDTAEQPAQVEETLEDADDNVRQAQLNSDIRAREERNDLYGDQQERAESDLESEVRSKLEANIPRGKLAVQADDDTGTVTIVGTVPNEKEYNTIEPLAKEILGVKAVKMDVRIVPPEAQTEENMMGE
jgi:osmotically-inducible protein OsmY